MSELSSVDHERHPRPAHADVPPAYFVEGGEGAVYKLQAQQARAAFAGASADLKRNLKQLADPSNVARRYPLATAGAAAGVGLIAALVLVPSKKQAAASRLRALERAIRDESAAGSGVKGGRPLVKPGPAKKLMRLAIQYGKPQAMRFLIGFLSGSAGSVAGQAAAQPDDVDADPAAPPLAPEADAT